jgi:hypothetical protein
MTEAEKVAGYRDNAKPEGQPRVEYRIFTTRFLVALVLASTGTGALIFLDHHFHRQKSLPCRTSTIVVGTDRVYCDADQGAQLVPGNMNGNAAVLLVCTCKDKK